MTNVMECPLCYGEVYSDIGNGCKMCGMPLENSEEEFCSMRCKEIYKIINKFVEV